MSREHSEFKKGLGTDMDELCAMGIHTVKEVMRMIKADSSRDPETAFETVLVGTDRKKALRVDVSAEDTCARTIGGWGSGRFKKIKVFGEERLRKPSLDLSNEKCLCALVDSVDGTDLLERGLGNWCTAIIFFAPYLPVGHQILASFVGLPTGEIYFARQDQENAFVIRGLGKDQRETVAGPSLVEGLHQASVCFYGQKPPNLLAVTERPFLPRLKEMAALQKARREEMALRLYTLAGIPMMMKLADKQVKNSNGIDVVFDVEGQKPHDMVPGAFIAKKAGATLKDLTGKEISYEQLGQHLLRPAAPDQEITYVLASTEKLADAMVNLLA